MTTKWPKPNNGELKNILKGNAYRQKAIGTVSVPETCMNETEEAQLESQNSEIKTISDQMKQVSKKANIKTSLY